MSVTAVMRKFDELIERLRDRKSGSSHGSCQDCYGTAMDDAADEIERMQADRRQVYKTIDDAGFFLFEHIDGTYSLNHK